MLCKRRFLMIAAFIISLLLSNYAFAGDFGILSETYVYPDGLQLDKDSKLVYWNNVASRDELQDKREGKKSLITYVMVKNMWFGFGIIWDPDNDDQPEPRNMSAYANGSLNLWVKTETPLRVGIKDSAGTEKWVRLDQAPFNVPSNNTWKFISIPMDTSFNGIDFSRVTQLFMVSHAVLPQTDMLTFNFDNVRWCTEEIGPLDHITAAPASFMVPKNYPKSFLATGYDASGNVRDIYPTWSANITGTFIIDKGPLSIFKPTVLGTSKRVTATEGSISAYARIDVKDITWNDFFNIFIDEGLYGSLGTYDSDGDTIENNKIDIATVTGTHPSDYNKSLRAIYTIKKDGWAGLFFQEGPVDDQASYRNLNLFSDGYLNFWVKTPVDLGLSVRTVDIPKGKERSKVILSDYNIPADNNWYEVNIALDDFKNKDDRLNFSKSKVFINAAVVGEEIGSDSSGRFFLSNIKYVRRKETPLSLTVSVKRRSDNQIVTSGRIEWSGVSLESGWAIANQYLEVSYNSINPSWGIQIYTDNMGDGASPKYTGSPTRYLDQQPVGLLGVAESFLNCPMAWMALDDINQNIPIPAEKDNKEPANTPKYKVFFKSDTNGMWGSEKAKGEWCWLKDKNSTKWNEDTDGDLRPDPEEIISDFLLTGDSYSTFLSPIGISTGWYDPSNASRVYVLNPEPPVILYFAANFDKTTILQKYKTNTITLELYHY